MKTDKTKRSNGFVRRGGFTVVEVLVALMVSAIILGAVASLAYALGKVSDDSDGLSRKQAHLRYTTTRLSQLIRYSKLVCYIPSEGDSLVLWRADDDDNDEINPTELVYIETGTDSNYIDLLEFVEPAAAGTIDIDEIQNGSIKTWLFANCDHRYTRIVPYCANLTITPVDMSPPYTELVNISFEVGEDDIMQTYQITAALRGRAVNLLDSGVIVDQDDD
jgi:prepilin-type N-terminal cleavage/methylation domain-containing protein